MVGYRISQQTEYERFRKRFFSSWFNIQGKKQTGYFIGSSFISELEKAYSLKEIALLDRDDVRKMAQEYLHSIS